MCGTIAQFNDDLVPAIVAEVAPKRQCVTCWGERFHQLDVAK